MGHKLCVACGDHAAMFPSLSRFSADTQLSIVPLDRTKVSSLDWFGGDFRVSTTDWVIAPKVAGGPVYAMAQLELQSPFIPKVLFAHLTLAKFKWPDVWDIKSFNAETRAELDTIGRSFRKLLDGLSLANVGPPSTKTPPPHLAALFEELFDRPVPQSSFLWHQRIERSWSKDAVVLNFHHPLYQQLHHQRTALSTALSTALPPSEDNHQVRLMNRSSFHISLDGVVLFAVAKPESGYLSWSKHELVAAFNHNKKSGVYREDPGWF